jgi:5'(3')-deoxyribonucleotidase
MTTLYLDMDGVLADFNHRAREVLKASSSDERAAADRGRWPEAEWKKLKHVPNFYRHLPKTDIADRLVTLARKFRDELGWEVRILTAIPKGNDMPDAFQDKMEWMQEHYPDLRVNFGPYSKDKHRHARPGDYLVDDRRDNCREWTEANGVAIKVDDSDRVRALDQLQEVYDRKQSFRRLAGMLPNQG